MEGLKLVVPFAHPGELDGFAGEKGYGKGGAASGIRVEFGQDHGVEADLLLEANGALHRVASGHGVCNEDHLEGADPLFDLSQLGHQLFVHVETSGGVENHGVVALRLGIAVNLFGGLDDPFGLNGVEGNTALLGDDTELFLSGGTFQVDRNQEGVETLLLQHTTELSGGRGLSDALETGEHEEGGNLRGDSKGFVLLSQDPGQLVVEDLDKLLARENRE